MNELRSLSAGDAATDHERLLEAQHLQVIEGNPLDATDVAMFAMFERERWSHEQCRAYIAEQARKMSVPAAAE